MSPRRQKILIVDDSAIIRDLVTDILESNGYDVVPMASAFGLANAIRRESPDLALVDVEMPGLPGSTSASIALRAGVTCPIVLFSDRSEADLQRLASEARVAGYIRKTDDPQRLVQAVARFVKPQ